MNEREHILADTTNKLEKHGAFWDILTLKIHRLQFDTHRPQLTASTHASCAKQSSVFFYFLPKKDSVVWRQVFSELNLLSVI